MAGARGEEVGPNRKSSRPACAVAGAARAPQAAAMARAKRRRMGGFSVEFRSADGLQTRLAIKTTYECNAVGPGKTPRTTRLADLTLTSRLNCGPLAASRDWCGVLRGGPPPAHGNRASRG